MKGVKNESFEQWEAILPQFPKWCFGGEDISLEQYDDKGTPFYVLQVVGAGIGTLTQYRQLLKQHGFVNRSEGTLCKNVDGAECCFDSEEPFAAGADCLGVAFRVKKL
jgi:hypothetical protein